MKKLMAILVASFAICAASYAAEYSLDDSSIDALMDEAVEVSAETCLDLSAASSSGSYTLSVKKSSVAAFVLNTFLGYFGIHRHYLGTRPGMWAIYTFTFGGIFGIVPFVDWIMLLVGMIDGDIDNYYGNPAFLMWAN